MVENVGIKVSDGVLVIALCASHMHDLTPASRGQVSHAIDRANNDASIKAILVEVIQGAPTSIAADADVRATCPDAVSSELLLLSIANVRKPMVAAVDGQVGGVVLALLLQCDLVYLAEDAVLAWSSAGEPSFVQDASSQLLSARVGHVRAFELLGLGASIDGRTAVDWGVANAAIPADQVLARAQAAAQALAARSAGPIASYAPSRLRTVKPVGDLWMRH